MTSSTRLKRKRRQAPVSQYDGRFAATSLHRSNRISGADFDSNWAAIRGRLQQKPRTVSSCHLHRRHLAFPAVCHRARRTSAGGGT